MMNMIMIKIIIDIIKRVKMMIEDNDDTNSNKR